MTILSSLFFLPLLSSFSSLPFFLPFLYPYFIFSFSYFPSSASVTCLCSSFHPFLGTFFLLSSFLFTTIISFFLPSLLPSFIHFFLPSFLPSSLPSFISFLSPICMQCFLSSFFRPVTFLPSFHLYSLLLIFSHPSSPPMTYLPLFFSFNNCQKPMS